MAESRLGPEDVPTSERMRVLGAAKASAIKRKALGVQQTEKGTDYSVDPGQVEALLEEWPAAPRRVGRLMLEQYGSP